VSGGLDGPFETYRANQIPFDPKLELAHLERALGLDPTQRKKVLASLKKIRKLYESHGLKRRAHQKETLALAKRIEKLTAAFEKSLKRMDSAEEKARDSIAAHLSPTQKKRYKKISAQRRRIEKEMRSRAKQLRPTHPPPKGPV